MTIPVRRCKPCGRVLPLTSEYFSRHKDGFDYRCKECRSRYFKADYYPLHSRGILDQAKTYRAEHREQIRQWVKGYAQRTKHLARARSRRFYTKHCEEIRQKQKAYNKKHPEKSNAHTRNRRAKLSQAEGTHTDQDVKRQYKAQNGRCYWCGKKVGKTYHVDHVIPVTRGGSNDSGNLVVACPSCNESKSNKLPHEWEGNGGKMF